MMKKKSVLIAHLFCYIWCASITPASSDECCIPEYNERNCCQGRFYVNADWLYFKTQQDNLSAGVFIDDFPDPTLKTVDAKLLEQNFQYESGFRVTAGYQAPNSQWQFDANYTYLPFHSNPIFNEGTGDSLPEHQQFISTNSNTFPILAVDQGFLSQRTKWHGNFSYVDIDLSRSINFLDCFHLRPHVGFRALWMDQTFFIDGALVALSINNSTFTRVRMKQKMQGYGIEGGFFSDFSIGYGFSLIGHFGGSILYSNFDVTLINQGFLGEEGPLVFFVNGKDHIKTAIPTVEYFVGLQYETTFSDIAVSAHVGWEQRVLFNINRIASINGNFSVQGLNLGLSVAF